MPLPVFSAVEGEREEKDTLGLWRVGPLRDPSHSSAQGAASEGGGSGHCAMTLPGPFQYCALRVPPHSAVYLSAFLFGRIPRETGSGGSRFGPAVEHTISKPA